MSDEQNLKEIETADLEDFTIDEEHRERQREQASYRWCGTVRKAGQIYRERGGVENVCDRLSLSRDAAEEALTVPCCDAN